jgi:phage protein D
MGDKATKPSVSANESFAASFRVDIGGNEFTQDKPEKMLRLVVETHLDKIGVAHVTLTGDIKPSDFNIGDDVTISVGGCADPAFVGVVTGFRHTWRGVIESVTVEAMDPLIKLAASRETKVWGGETTDEIKDSDAANDAISAGGCDVGNVEDTPGTRPYILQRNESNLAFLKRLAARNGYLVFCEEGKVNFQKPQFSGQSIEITQPDIKNLDYSRSDIEIPNAVYVEGWDYIAKERVMASSSSVTGIGGGTPVSATTYGADLYISDVFVSSESGAKEMAEAEMNRLARSFVRGACTVLGNGQLKIGGKVKFLGFYEKFNPEGLVVGVRHVVEPGTVFDTTVWFVGNTEPE